jgi:simple sugar transport system substrate-binding protein
MDSWLSEAKVHLELLRPCENSMSRVLWWVGTTSPNQAGQYLDDGSMTKSILWDPGEAGYAMVWLAKQVLDKKQVSEGTEIPTIGKIPSLKENTITYDRPLILDKGNRKQYDF